MFRSNVLPVNFFCAALALAATAACGGAVDDGSASLSGEEAAAIESSGEALHGGSHGGNGGHHSGSGRCRYRNRHTHEESYSDYYGEEHSCTPGHRDRWFEQCRDRHDATEEYACEPTDACNSSDDWHCENNEHGWSRENGCCEYHGGGGGHHDNGPRCLYERHGRVSTHDYYGRERSCTPGPSHVWFETCRDHQRDTEEVGCECASGYYYTNCWGQWTCMPHGSVC